MDPEVCLRNMEEELIQNRLRTDRIEAALQAILNKLDASRHGENIMQDSPSFGMVELEKMSESNGGKAEEKGAPKLAKVRLAIPMDFDGDHRKGHAFFNTCCLYFVIIRDLFPNNQARIHWALSFFKLDCVAHFANKVLWHKTKGKGNYFQDWDTFEKMFSNQFCPKNEQLMALTRLEGTSWYQAKDPVDDYIDRFQELTDLVEYDDDKTIVIKFWCRLDPALQNQVALLGDGAPNFDDPEGWYEDACKVSWNREANEAC